MSLGYCGKLGDFKLMVEGEPFDQMLDGPLDDEEQDGDDDKRLYRTKQDHDFSGKVKRSVFNVTLGDTYE